MSKKGLMRRGRSGSFSAPPTYTTTWNPSDKAVGITLSGGNLTASVTSGGTIDRIVRATAPGYIGRYFEVTFTTMFTDATHMSGVGIANTTHPLSTYLGGGGQSIGCYGNGYYEGPDGFGTTTTFGASNVIGVLLTSGGTLVFSKAGTVFKTFTVLPTGAIYPAIDVLYSDVCVGNFGASAFANLPSGATGWNG